MDQINYLFRTTRKEFFFLALSLLLSFVAYEQTCTIGVPALFGNPVDKIVCRGNDAQLGVNGSVVTQDYFFYAENGTTASLGGPLVGNGGQLSVDAAVASSADAGRYYVATREGGTCWATNQGFYVYYGNIDNLNITAWGNNAVSFNWASSGRSPYVRYMYAVTTQPNADNIPDSDTATTFNTAATVTGLTAGILYYIHVKVYKVYQQPLGGGNFNGPVVSNECFSDIPWSTLSFRSCAGAAPIGSITSTNPYVCSGFNSNTLTASQGSTYQWYRNGTSLAAQGNTPSIIISQGGNYSTFITTGAGCQGIAYSKYITERIATAGAFTGGGSFCVGDEVKLKIRATQPDQAYEIRKDGQAVTSFWGIGTSFGSPPTDTIHYNFIITSASQAGNYKVATSAIACPAIIFGNENVVLLSTASVGSISGSATVAQHPTNTSPVTFTGSGGVTPYLFTYKINGGANQTISTTGVNTTVTIPQSQAAVGTYQYTLVSMRNAAGCFGNLTGPTSATISVVIPAPDLTNSQFFSTTQVAPGGFLDEVIVVRNVGIVATTNQIVFNVTNYSPLSGLTVTSNTNPTVTIGFTPFTLDNSNWTFNPATGVFTSNPGIVIAPNGVRNVGIRIARAAGANGSVSHTATINTGTGGGEVSISNNSISNNLLKN